MEQITKALELVEKGEASALEAYISIHRQLKQSEGSLERLKELALEEAAKHGQKEFTAHGALIRLQDGRRKFDYKGIKEWSDLKAKMKAIEEQAQLDYRQYENGSRLMATQDGEEVTLPQVTYGKPVIAIKHI